jgi:GNAT superfamily N-acetyltransferase
MNREFSSEAKAYQYGDLDNIQDAYGKLREKFLVAEENSDIIGTVGVKEDNDSTALLRRFFVHLSHRGRGIGSMLIDTALDFCKLNGYKQVVFRATSNMKEALKLLKSKKGFIENERYLFDNVEIIILHYKIH